MNPYEYGYEKVDLRLFCLLFLKKTQVLLISVIGAVFLGLFFLWALWVVGPMKEFQAESMYYVEFTDQDLGQSYNSYTWAEWLHTDELIQKIQGNLESEYTDKELRDSILAFLLADVRMPSTRVTAMSSDEAVLILKATEIAVLDMVNELKEVESIRILSTMEEGKNTVVLDTYIRVGLLAGFLGFLISTTVVTLCLLWDSKIYLANTLLKRYNIPVVSSNRTEEISVQLAYFLKDKSKCGVVSELCQNDSEEILAILQKYAKDTEFKMIQKFMDSTDTLEDVLILAVEAEKTKRQQIEYILDAVSMYHKKIDFIFLLGENKRLVKTYYFMDKMDGGK